MRSKATWALWVQKTKSPLFSQFPEHHRTKGKREHRKRKQISLRSQIRDYFDGKWSTVCDSEYKHLLARLLGNFVSTWFWIPWACNRLINTVTVPADGYRSSREWLSSQTMTRALGTEGKISEKYGWIEEEYYYNWDEGSPPSKDDLMFMELVSNTRMNSE